MTGLEDESTNEQRYLALKARDSRFDGLFFTGVTSTGIYCRPVCRVRTPKRENCRFFSQPAQAEGAGFRPCLRCRPELAPRAHTANRSAEARVWSMQDASSILAGQAADLIDRNENWNGKTPSMQQLAQRLGVSDRHLRRIFEAHFGVSPLQYLQTRRLLSAKQFLTDTTLPVSEVALLSGFASVRSFNTAFAQHYALNPSQLRRSHDAGRSSQAEPGFILKLAYRAPYDVRAILQFFASRSVAGMELISLLPGPMSISKTVSVDICQQHYIGWLVARFDAVGHHLELRLSDSLRPVLPALLARVRSMLDLDADPLAINSLLHASFPQGDGLRVPGSLDGFELAVRAVLGQQITVAAARTLTTRLVQAYGEPIETPIDGLNRLFPRVAALANASPDALGRLGIVKQRQAAIQALAGAVLTQGLQLHPGADVEATMSALKALPGIGDWTAQYIAMRALRWPDAFPAGDVALQRALGLQDCKHPAKEAELKSKAWQPWRSYAVIRAWQELVK
jgi:AraC family transcriptional regulator of adaptative response / DNA-3-methyladenine glycosylase II